MSYTIKIGSAILVSEEGWLDAHVPKISAQGAPSYPGDFPPDLGTNQRSPSYSGWATFTERTGLRSLFYSDRGLLKRHPGVAALTKDHLHVVSVALDRFVTKNPTAKPGWCLCSKCAEDFCASIDPDAKHDPDLDGDLARLKWLGFWIELVLKGADPAMENY